MHSRIEFCTFPPRNGHALISLRKRVQVLYVHGPVIALGSFLDFIAEASVLFCCIHWLEADLGGGGI